MITKNDLINDVAYAMEQELTPRQLEKLKITLIVKLKNFDITEVSMLPSIDVHDNEWIFQRFLIDEIAKGNKKSSIKNYLSAVKDLLRETGKNYKQITSQDITDFLAVRQYRDGISINYKANLYRYLSSFWGWAYQKDHIYEDIMKKVDPVRSIQKKKDRLTDEEIEDIREACETKLERALFELMIATGMRVGEIVALNVNDLDLSKKRVTIFGEKTNRYRTGMLSTKAVKAIRAYLKERPGDSEALFVSSRRPYGRLGRSSIEKIAKTIAARVEAHLVATVHVYRKTFASVLFRKTKNVLLVSKLLGHAKTDMTIQYYLVDDIEDMQYQYNIATS